MFQTGSGMEPARFVVEKIVFVWMTKKVVERGFVTTVATVTGWILCALLLAMMLKPCLHW